MGNDFYAAKNYFTFGEQREILDEEQKVELFADARRSVRLDWALNAFMAAVRHAEPEALFGSASAVAHERSCT